MLHRKSRAAAAAPLYERAQDLINANSRDAYGPKVEGLICRSLVTRLRVVEGCHGSQYSVNLIQREPHGRVARALARLRLAPPELTVHISEHHRSDPDHRTDRDFHLTFNAGRLASAETFELAGCQWEPLSSLDWTMPQQVGRADEVLAKVN